MLHISKEIFHVFVAHLTTNTEENEVYAWQMDDHYYFCSSFDMSARFIYYGKTASKSQSSKLNFIEYI